MGEGYQGESLMIRTMPYSKETLGCIYSWGFNANSQLALQDEQLIDNPDYEKNVLMTPLKSEHFKNNLIQASCGNVSSIFLFFEEENNCEIII